MNKKNKNLVFLLIGAVLLLSFVSGKKSKNKIIISPLETNNLYALERALLYNQDGSRVLYTFKGGELLTIVTDNSDIYGDYFIEYNTPQGQKIQGYINIYDTEIK
jgi:hypothetical protein